MNEVKQELKKVKKELERVKDERNFLKILLNHTSDSIIVSDIRGKCLYANKSVCEGTGYSLGEICSLT